MWKQFYCVRSCCQFSFSLKIKRAHQMFCNDWFWKCFLKIGTLMLLIWYSCSFQVLYTKQLDTRMNQSFFFYKMCFGSSICLDAQAVQCDWSKRVWLHFEWKLLKFESSCDMYIFRNLEGIKIFTIKMYMVDHVAKDESWVKTQNRRSAFSVD